MATRWLIIVILVETTVVVGSAGDYELDLKNPTHLLEVPRRIPLPTRVDIYRTGPRIYIDKADTPRRLATRDPLCSLTNRLEIEELVGVLAKADNKQRITNVTHQVGHTYHLLLFQDADHTVIHFRVFEPTESRTSWCNVYPRDSIGFTYFNNRIGPWLHSRLKSGTNAVPAVSGASTSISLKPSQPP